MACLYNFCFYFSLRLGGVMIGIFSLLQGVAMVILFSTGLNDLEQVSRKLDLWSKEYTFDFMTSTFETIQLDPEKYLVIFLTLSSFYTLSCIMLIYGAFTCNTYIMYPYLVLELLRAIALSSTHVIAMMLIKQNVINLGFLIGLTVLGGFLLLGFFYMWFCILSLHQLIRELMTEIEITDITNFPQKPANNDMFSTRHRMAYKY